MTWQNTFLLRNFLLSPRRVYIWHGVVKYKLGYFPKTNKKEKKCEVKGKFLFYWKIWNNNNCS